MSRPTLTIARKPKPGPTYAMLRKAVALFRSDLVPRSVRRANARKWSYNPDFPENLQLIVRRIKRDEQAIKKLADEVATFIEEVRAETESVRNLKVAA